MHKPIVQRKQTSEQYSEPEFVTSALTLAGNQIKCIQPETDSITGNLFTLYPPMNEILGS